MFYNVCILYCTINFQNIKIKNVTKIDDFFFLLIKNLPEVIEKKESIIHNLAFTALKQLMNILT